MSTVPSKTGESDTSRLPRSGIIGLVRIWRKKPEENWAGTCNVPAPSIPTPYRLRQEETAPFGAVRNCETPARDE